MVKRVAIVLGVLILVLLIAVAVLWIHVDQVAAGALTSGIEHVGGVRCTVGNVTVSILSGQVGIKGLAIRNPQGYADADMFAVNDARLEVRVGSLWNQPVHVRRLEIVRPLVRVDAGPGGTNVSVFLENVQRNLGDAEAEPQTPPTRMWVDRLLIQDATVRIGTGLTRKELLTIPRVCLARTDIRGQDGKGVTSGELAALIVFDLVQKGAVEGRLNLETLIPLELVKGLDALRLTASSLLNGTLDLITKPMGALLKAASSKDSPEQPETP